MISVGDAALFQDSCDFVVDLDLEQRWTRNSSWSIVARYPFLNAAESHPLFRAFYVPFTSRTLSFADYLLLERKREEIKQII